MAKARKLRVYHDHDGTYREMVAAHNLKEAAHLLNTTVGSIRNYGGTFGPVSSPVEYELATGKPGVVFRRDMRVLKGGEWEEV